MFLVAALSTSDTEALSLSKRTTCTLAVAGFLLKGAGERHFIFTSRWMEHTDTSSSVGSGQF